MSQNIVFVHDLPADPNNPNGPTIREENMQKEHKIPLDSLVEVKYDDWFGDGACAKVHARLWVVDHTRDCDGTPLYTLADHQRIVLEESFGVDFNERMYVLKANMFCHVFESGFSEERLTVIESSAALDNGEGALTWDEE